MFRTDAQMRCEIEVTPERQVELPRHRIGEGRAAGQQRDHRERTPGVRNPLEIIVSP